MSNTRRYYGGTQSLDAVTIAWLAQLTTSFGTNPSSAYITALNNFIAGMRTDGELLLLDRFWIFAQEVQGYARVSIVNPTSTQITEVNTPTWTANQGYTGNGINRYLTPNFNFRNDGVNAVRASISHGVYVRSNVTENKAVAGVTDGTSQVFLRSRRSDANAHGSANSNNITVVVAAASGLLAAQRTTNNAAALFRNGSSIGTTTGADPQLANLGDMVFGFRNSGGVNELSSNQISMRFIGSGAMNMTDFYNRWTTFATAIGL